jgi:alkylation response protein AidB-like acyl-CoA dehydrogenase
VKTIGAEERAALEDSVRGLLDRRSSSEAVRAVTEGDCRFDQELWAEMAALGWAGLLVPERFGGAEAGLSAVVPVMRQLGAHTTPSPYLSSGVLAAAALASGSESTAHQWLAGIASGDAIGAVGLTGPAGRVGAGGFDVVATPDAGSYRLLGTAAFVLDGDAADVVIVGATHAETGSPVLLAAARTLEGISSLPLHVIDRTRQLSHLRFDETPVDSAATVAEGGDAVAVLDSLVDVAAIAIAADAIGAARRALDMSVAYAKERVQFDRPIGSFQAIKHKLADMFVLVEASEAAVAGAARAFDVDPRGARRRAATAGSFCRQAASRVVGDAVQTHGGIGFTWEHDCHLLLKRAKFDELYLTDVWSQRERLVDSVAAAVLGAT